MKFLPLVWRNLMRRKIRTTFTLLSIFVAFLLYAFLMTIRTAFSMGVEVAGVDRLMMMGNGRIQIIGPKDEVLAKVLQRPVPSPRPLKVVPDSGSASA